MHDCPIRWLVLLNGTVTHVPPATESCPEVRYMNYDSIINVLNGPTHGKWNRVWNTENILEKSKAGGGKVLQSTLFVCFATFSMGDCPFFSFSQQGLAMEFRLAQNSSSPGWP